jgi:hypothetical protein
MKHLKTIFKFFIFLLCSVLLACSPVPDDTDSSPNMRSKMTLLIDHDTGCQYLYRQGQVALRMDSDGTSFCGKPLTHLDGSKHTTISIDFGTGCQYVSYGFHGLMPRLDAKSVHICDAKLKRATQSTTTTSP